MFLVGLTGNYGMGKSTVLKIFRDLGAITFDADEIVSSLLLVESVRTKIGDLLGSDVFLADGRIDTKKVASIIFSHAALRRSLEDILHPLVFSKIEDFLEQADKKSGIVIIEVPLLFEREYANRFRKIITVRTEKQRTLERLAAKGVSREDALLRICSQLPVAEKIAKSDFVIHNDGPLEDTEKQVREIYAKLLNEGRRGDRCRS